MTEVWKPVLGFEGRYEVSNLGRVRSLPRTVYVDRQPKGYSRQQPGKVLSQSKHPGGYLQVGLWRENTEHGRKVHRLVLESFVGPRPKGMEACHGDGNPANNRLENLRWDCPGGNERDKVAHGTHRNARKTHCPRGHLLKFPNLHRSHWEKKKARTCQACHRASAYVQYYPERSDDIQAISDNYYTSIIKEHGNG